MARNKQSSGETPNPLKGVVFSTGTMGSKAWWHTISATDKTVVLEKLAWCEDMIKFPGMMYGTGKTIRRKLHSDVPYCRALGSFTPCPEISVLDTPNE